MLPVQALYVAVASTIVISRDAEYTPMLSAFLTLEYSVTKDFLALLLLTWLSDLFEF